MVKELPRIETVKPEAGSVVRIRWRGRRASDTVNLAGWIATGGDVLKALRDPAVFARAHVENHGAAVAWDDGDLAIDAHHLKTLAEEQKPFDKADAIAWQAALELSNNEAATLLGIGVSTWNAYKAGTSPIPAPLAMLCRAMLRDPVLLQAHYRPRIAGRPRREIA